MRSTLVTPDPARSRTYMLVLDAGDEVMASLLEFAKMNDVRSARFTGLGAVSSSVIAFYHRDRQEYEDIPVDSQHEVLSLIGNISMLDGEPRIHAHVVLGATDGSTCGGHLMSAQVWPALEVTLDVHETPLERRLDDASGLPLIAL
jgi:predicted DNA-binding protein with PD1-like motif